MIQRILPVTLLLVACLLTAARADETPSTSFITAATVAEVGRTRIVAFRVANPPAADQAWEAAVADPTVLQIVRAPAALAGQSIGYLRVRGLKTGVTQLTVGSAKIDIRVVTPRAPVDPERFAPEITCPADGAAVWGVFSVGVEIEDGSEQFSRSLELRLSTGQRIAPVADGHPARGPSRKAAFRIDADGLPAGPIEITPVALASDGSKTAGDPVTVRVIRPAAGAVMSFEAEDPGEVQRPDRFGKEKPLVLVDPAASGSEYVSNAGPLPAVCIPVKIAEAGLYQTMIVARGTNAGGALPSVGLYVDNGNQPATNGCLVEEAWHRIALGVPVQLAAGDRLLTPFYLNDFAGGNLADRNLYLDKIEIVRADAGRKPLSGAATLGNGGGMADMAGGAMTMEGGGVAKSAPAHVVFSTSLDGRTVTGVLEVRGLCTWENRDKTAPPPTTLWINGRAWGTQRAATPRFWVDPSAFEPGPNRLQLKTGEAATLEQTVTWSGPVGGRPRAFHRYTLHEEGWEAGIAKRLSNQRDPAERRALFLGGNGRAALKLPADLVGLFQVYLEARGDDFKGPPIAKVSLAEGKKSQPIGEAPAPGYWETLRIGKVDLAAGAKQLVVAYENDLAEKGAGDRNLYIQAVILHEVRPEPDRLAPQVRVLYPPADEAVYRADAVVCEAIDDDTPAAVELMIDGAATGLRLDGTRRTGRLVLPLLARSLKPGAHALAVRATDPAGNVGVSDPVRFTVLDAPPESPGTYARAVRLLDRFAYGPESEELAAVLTMGEKAWLEDRLSRPMANPGDAAALEQAVAQFPNTFAPQDIAGRVIEHVALTNNPVRARFVQWVENHFSTWMRKTSPEMEWAEHLAFLRLGATSFPDLLEASADSPAMLRYLDAQQSVARRLNENYAREIMELHTLGVNGGYTQADVTTLAHLLTGWSFSEEGDGHSAGQARRREFRFDPQLNEGDARRWLGMAFPKASPVERYDRSRMALEVLSAHPSTARFVCTKLAWHYCGVPAPERMVADLAEVFLATHGDLKAVLVALAAHPDFWAQGARDKIATPFDYALRYSRVCGIAQPGPVQEFLQRSGMGLFERPTPDGYPEEDMAYTDTNAVIQRWKLARRWEWAIAGLVPGPWRARFAPEAEDKLQDAVDLVAVRFTGRVLGDASNQSVLDVLHATKGDAGARLHALTTLIAQLPEASLR